MHRRTAKTSPKTALTPLGASDRAQSAPMPLAFDIENLPLNDTDDSAAVSAERQQSSKEAGPSRPVTAVPRNSSALPTSFELERHGHSSEPSAKWYHAAFHTVTAMVGAGVLALPYSFSYLTWSGGFVCLALCTGVSLYCSHLLAVLHEGPDQIRYNRYRDLGRAVLGYRAGSWTIVPVQFAVCIGLDIAYTLTAGQSLQAVQNPACNMHTVAKTTEHAEQSCATALNWWIAGFALFQILLSQLKDFHSLWWVSLVGALMSALYSTIAFAASVAAYRPGVDHSMRPGSSADRVFGVLNAIGTILFAFGGQSVQLEIQATLARPPSPYTAMMKGIGLAYVLIVLAYFGVSIAGFAAYGNSINPDILLSISEPQWLIKMANLMVVVHVAASFQLFAHPVFEAAERLWTRMLYRKTPDIEVPFLLRAGSRALYCAFCAGITIVLPFFNDVIGIVGSAGFVPMSFIFPCLFYIMSKKCKGQWEYWLNVAIMAVMGLAGTLACIGSLRNIVLKAESYHY